MRLFTFLCFATLTAFAVPSRSAADDAKPAADVKGELKLLEGAWTVVGLESEGKKAPAEALKGMSWSFSGAKITLQ